MSDRLVVVETFPISALAEIARARLEADGIRAFVEDAAAVDAYSVMSIAMGGVKLKVAEKDLEQATYILSGDASDSVEDSLDYVDVHDPFADVVDDIEPDEADLPIPDDAPDNPSEQLAKRWLRTAFFSILFPPLLLYAVWLGLRYTNSMQPVRVKYSNHVVGALVLTVLLLIVWYIVIF